MPDLGTQLKDYLDETAPPVEFEEVIALIEDRSPDVVPLAVIPPPRRRVWLVGVAAFAIVILVLGGLSLLFGNGGGAEPATPTTVAPVSPATVDSPEPTAPENSPEPSTPETGLIPGGPESVRYVATWSTSGEFLAREADVFYLDENTWRMEVTESFTDVSPPEETGVRIFVKNNNEMFEFVSLMNTFQIFDLTNECPRTGNPDDVSDGCADHFYVDLDPIADGSYPLQFKDFVCDEDDTCVGPGSGELAWVDCSVEPGGLVAGSETNYYTCQRDLSFDGVTTQTQTLELWMGTDGTTLKWVWTIPHFPDDLTPGDETITAYEVAVIDHAPNFDPSLFDFECPTENCTNLNAGPDPLAQPMVGQPAPETSGNLLTGEPFELSEFIGGKVIVAFEASWCPPCEDHLIDLQTLQERSRDITIIVLLPADEPANSRRYLNQNNIQLLAVNPTQDNNTVIRQWQAPGYPTTYLIDENGTIQAVFVGALNQTQLDQLLNELGW